MSTVLVVDDSPVIRLMVSAALTQIDLADMCGTTPIHMNRALGELRREDIAEFRRGLVVVREREQLERQGDFDPAYLYGEGPLRVGHELDGNT